MAKYRNIQINFWQDPFVESLNFEEKSFFIYLLTNSKTTQCGVYETSVKLIAYETDLSKTKVSELIKRFVEFEKIIFNEENGEILIKNWLKHNSFKSPKIYSCIKKEVESIKTVEFKNFIIEKIGVDLSNKETNEKDLKKAKEIAEKKGVENVEAYAKAMVNNGFTSNSETEDERRTKIILKKELRDLEERKEILKDKLEPENAARINQLKKILRG